MYVADHEITSDGTNWIVVQETQGLPDLLAVALDEFLCSHPEGKTGRCILAPPNWSWYVGLGYRGSLGTALFNLGQRVSGRISNMPEVYRREMTDADLKPGDWPARRPPRVDGAFG